MKGEVNTILHVFEKNLANVVKHSRIGYSIIWKKPGFGIVSKIFCYYIYIYPYFFNFIQKDNANIQVIRILIYIVYLYLIIENQLKWEKDFKFSLFFITKRRISRLVCKIYCNWWDYQNRGRFFWTRSCRGCNYVDNLSLELA